MSNKQFLAQMGVFALLGLNVAAYYFFWPSSEGRTSNDVKPAVQKKSAPNNEAEEQEIAVFANNKKPELSTASFPLAMLPEIPVSQSVGSKGSKEPLVDAVPFESKPALPAPAPFVPMADPPIFPLVLPRDELPRKQEGPPQVDHVVKELLKQVQQVQKVQSQELKLPPVVIEPSPSVPASNVVENKNTSPPEPASPELTAKAAQSPWLLNVEMVGLRTQLIAQLRQKAGDSSLARFEIFCDRLEMRAPDGALQALGNVSFNGAGLKGKCKRLTLPLGETRIVFEETVEMIHAVKQSSFFWLPLKPGSSLEQNVPPGCTLRGEKIIWEYPTPPRAVETKTSDVRPASFGVPGTTTPLTPVPPVLGGPK